MFFFNGPWLVSYVLHGVSVVRDRLERSSRHPGCPIGRGCTGCMRWDIRRRGCDTWRPREPPEPPRYLTNVIENEEKSFTFIENQ